jgi:hypothetical protein
MESTRARPRETASGHLWKSSSYTVATVFPRERCRRTSATRTRNGSRVSRHGKLRRFALPHARSGREKAVADATVTGEPYGCVTLFTDGERAIGEDREMNVLVTITVLDESGDEIDTSSASAETPAEAFELALGQLELEPEA